MSLKKLPIGYSSLNEIIKGDCVYVDKSRFVHMLTTMGKYFFLSRPRRFGKSLFVDTLHQAFTGNREVFKGLDLEGLWDWDVEYPVIRFSFGGMSAFNSQEVLNTIIYNVLRRCAERYDVEVNTDQPYGTLLTDLVQALYQKYNQPVVILVDEYDKPILDVITDNDEAHKNREILKGLYGGLKDLDQYLKMVFLTGVSKFSKVSLFSGLNNLMDLSLSPAYADVCGYTQSELEYTFADRLEGVDKKKLKQWYNGYGFAGSDQQKVYNPFDILLFFMNEKLYKNYWFETATPTFLIKLLKKNQYYVPDFESLAVAEGDLSECEVEKIPFVALAFQTGYLTVRESYEGVSGQEYVLSYPNKEVKVSLNRHIANMGSNVDRRNSNVQAMYRAVRALDMEGLKQSFQSFFSSIPNDWYRNNNISQYEGFYCSIVYSYFCASGYDVFGEDVTSRGRIDLTVRAPNAIFIFEFKIAGAADEAVKALEQIKTKNYADKYKTDERPIYLLGIAFDDESRNLVGYEWELFVG